MNIKISDMARMIELLAVTGISYIHTYEDKRGFLITKKIGITEGEFQDHNILRIENVYQQSEYDVAQTLNVGYFIQAPNQTQSEAELINIVPDY